VSRSGTANTGYARWPRWLRWAIELSLFGIVFLLVYSWQTRDLLPVDDQRPAPALQGPLLDGGRLDLQEMRGRPVVVYFFAPWCKVCAFSASTLQGLRDSYGEGELGIVMVALSYDSEDAVRAFRDRHDLSVPVLLGNADIATRWNIFGFPTYYVLDSRGRIASRDFGVSTGPGLRLRVLNVTSD
jgi:peroxiredoxin